MMINNVIISLYLSLNIFIQQFPFNHSPSLITGFTINIHQRENKADILLHSKFYPSIINHSTSHIHFYQTQTYKKATIDYQYQQQSSIGPEVYLYQIPNNNITTIDQTKYISEIRLAVMPQ